MTEWQRSELKRRLRIIARVQKRLAAGVSLRRALRWQGISPVTWWRYQRRVTPITNRCGRKSLASGFEISTALIARLQLLQLNGIRNSAAWRIGARYPECPDELRRFIRKSAAIPESLLKLTRIKRAPVTAYRGANFFHIEQNQ